MRKHIQYNKIEVIYEENLHGGGIRFGQQFIPVIKEKFGHVRNIFEFCAGPGFIGFSLLANKLCDRLTVADINPEAVRVLNETIKINHLESTVSAYLSDCLDDIPETEKWDLVVGNPPHVLTANEEDYKKDITLYDPHFRIHNKFYQNIRKFLKPTGSVLLQEHSESTSVDDFKEMIEKNGLKIIEVFKYEPPIRKSGTPITLRLLKASVNPSRFYRAIKRRVWPAPPRNYYFIHCKLA